MKRRYKLLIIIVVGTILGILINHTKANYKITIVAMGDSFSVAKTPYRIPGSSFTDYVSEYLDSENRLENYNYEYSIDHLTISDLVTNLDNNTIGTKSKTPIKQVLAKAEIITIAIGIDEFGDTSLRKDITEDDINEFIMKYKELLTKIREFYQKDIIIIGLYPVYNFKQSSAIEVNKKLSILCGNYNAKFIDIMPYAINDEYHFSNDYYYLNYKVHKKIAEIIIKNTCQ